RRHSLEFVPVERAGREAKVEVVENRLALPLVSAVIKEEPLTEEELKLLVNAQQELWLGFKSSPAFISDLDDLALEKQLAQELEEDLLLLLDELSETEDPTLKKQLGGRKLSLKVESIELSKFSKDLEDLELDEIVDGSLIDLLSAIDDFVDIPVGPPPRKIPEGEGGKGFEVVGQLLSGEEPDEDYDPSTPFGDKDEPVGPRGPRFPQPFPPEGWLKTVGDYISGRKKKSKYFPSKDEKAALRTLEAMHGAFTQRGTIDQRSDAVRDMIHSQLGVGYTGSGAKKRERGETRHLAEAELQQAMLVVESLLQEGTGLVGGSKGLVISAVTSLSEADQLKLFEADELSGRRLYSLLYMTAKGNPELKPLFKKVKAASQRARIARRLDTHDRSGESSKAMEELQLHLTQSGLSEEDRQAFTDKLDFKMVLAGGQKKDPDLRLPDTSQEGWRGKFLCQSLGILAETPEISDESLRKALDLPPTDLLNLIAYAAIGDEVTHSGAQQSGRV
ncbi:MAG TPA: hypothetical protein PKY30_17595, partial [Myxococcota bacterium]|nr:hypothetical protein [Myxococcota bacterium]